VLQIDTGKYGNGEKLHVRNKMNHMNNKELLERFDFFGKLPEDERRYLLDYVTYRDVHAGTIMIEENTSCAGVSFVLSGEFRAYKVSENGREVSLYSIFPGDTCVMTIACLLGLNHSMSPLSVVAVQDSRIAVIPADKFRYVYSVSPFVQQYVFINVLNKFYDIIELVERLTFKSVTERLREYLVENTGGGKKPVYSTHAELAAKLGTSREVITRKLGELENEGFVKTERGKIVVIGLKELKTG
jgi:CRP/FNR family transcriptional regulator